MLEEKEIQDDILDYFEKLDKLNYPILYDRRQAGGFNYKKGIPDLWASIQGKHLEIEVKRPGEHLRPMQEKFRDECKRKNIIYICADSLNKIKELLKNNFGDNWII